MTRGNYKVGIFFSLQKEKVRGMNIIFNLAAPYKHDTLV